MKVTLNTLADRCRELNNGTLKQLPWGVSVERWRGGNLEVVVSQVWRKSGQGRDVIFTGSTQLVMAFLSGLGFMVAAAVESADVYRQALIKTGCHDIFCAESQRVCRVCPASHDNKPKQEVA